jgi:hypothetical protein
MRRYTARSSGAVVAGTLWGRGWITHYNQGPVITHTYLIILISTKSNAHYSDSGHDKKDGLYQFVIFFVC